MRNSIELEENYAFTLDLSEFKIILEDSLEGDADIMCCFDNGAIHKNGAHYGHVVLIDQLLGTNLILIDPDTDYDVEVSLDDLIRAIAVHGKPNRAGLWCINTIEGPSKSARSP